LVHTVNKYTNNLPPIAGDNNSIHNLTTNCTLTHNNASTLALGLNYIPLPKPNKNFKQDMLNQFEVFARQIRIKKYFATIPNGDDDNNAHNTHNVYLKLDYNNPNWSPPTLFPVYERYLQQVKHNIITAIDNHEKFKYVRNPQWLQSSINELTNMTKDNMIIKNADKNMGVTIQNRIQYEQDCMKQLSDITTYSPINKTNINFSNLFDEVAAILQRHNKLYTTYNGVATKRYSKLAQYILQMNTTDIIDKHIRLARFYILYKVHKSPVVGRPICSNIDTVTYYASKYVDKHCQPILNLANSYVKSSQSLVLLLDTYQVHNDYKDSMVIVCADVTNLYPSIPILQGIQFMRDRLRFIFEHNDSNTVHSTFKSMDDIDFICELTQWVLQNNYIEFGNLQFKQIQGTAMGTPVAVVFANLFLQQLEHVAMHKLTNQHPILYKRFIDDIFSVFKTRQHALEFINTYNSIVDSINVTHTVDNNEGVFLDLIIYKGTSFNNHNKLDVRLYQKKQNKYLYLPPFSHHTKPIFKSFINAELDRIMLNCSTVEHYNINKQLFYQRLRKRTYATEFLNKIFTLPRNRASILERIKQNQSNHKAKQLNKPIIFKTIYNQEMTQFNLKPCLKLTNEILEDEHLQQVFNNKNPIICYQRSSNLGNMLTQSKYKYDVTT
jgi:hypothetical protein